MWSVDPFQKDIPSPEYSIDAAAVGRELCSDEGRDFRDWHAVAFSVFQQVTEDWIYLTSYSKLLKPNQVRGLGIYLHAFSQITIPSPRGSSRLKYLYLNTRFNKVQLPQEEAAVWLFYPAALHTGCGV